MTTHVIMIVDASASMIPYRSDTIAGYNGYIADLAKDTEQEYTVTTVVFSSHNYFETIALCRRPNDPNLILNDGSSNSGHNATDNDHGQTEGSVTVGMKPFPEVHGLISFR